MLMLIIQLSKNKLKQKLILIIRLDKVMRPLVLIMLKMSGYVKTFKVKDGDKGKNKKAMSFCIQMMRSYQKNIRPFGLRLKI